MRIKNGKVLICIVLVFCLCLLVACSSNGNASTGTGGANQQDNGAGGTDGTDGTGGTGGGTGADITFTLNLGANYYIVTKEMNAYQDVNENVHNYETYRTFAHIGDVYYFKEYDENYSDNEYSEYFYVKCTQQECNHDSVGTHYVIYSRFSANVPLEENVSTAETVSGLNVKLNMTINNCGLDVINTYYTADTKQYIDAGDVSTHTPTGMTTTKYVYGVGDTDMYEFYIEQTTKACLKFVDKVTSYREGGRVIEATTFSIGNNVWGANGVPALPAGSSAPNEGGGNENPEDPEDPEDPASPTKLAAPVVTISNGTASWGEIENAQSYIYKINGGAEQPTNYISTTLSLNDSIVVKAVGDGTSYSDSDWSASKTYTESGGNGGSGGGSSVCPECGNELTGGICTTDSCTKNPDWVCDSYYDVLNNTTGAETEDDKCDTCGHTESEHTSVHQHVDDDLDLICDNIDCEYYMPTLNLPSNFTLIYEDGNNVYRDEIVRDGGKIYFKRVYVATESINEELLYVWSNDASIWKKYYRNEGVWEDAEQTYTNEYDVIRAISGGISLWYAEAIYQNSSAVDTPVLTGQTVAGRTCSVYFDDEYDCNFYVDDSTGLVLKALDLVGGAPGALLCEATSYTESGSLTIGYDPT